MLAPPDTTAHPIATATQFAWVGMRFMAAPCCARAKADFARSQREPRVQCFGASRAFADPAIAGDQHRCAPQAKLRREFQVAIKGCRIVRAIGHGLAKSLGGRARFRTEPGQQEGVDRHVVEFGEFFVHALQYGHRGSLNTASTREPTPLTVFTASSSGSVAKFTCRASAGVSSLWVSLAAVRSCWVACRRGARTGNAGHRHRRRQRFAPSRLRTRPRSGYR